VKSFIAGFAHSPPTRKPSHVGRISIRAINEAIADAGLERSAIDGLLVGCSPAASPEVRGWLQPNLAREAALADLALLSNVDLEGVSAMATIQVAAMAVRSGFAEAVMCVFADTPIGGQGPGGASFTAPTEAGSLNSLYSFCGGVGGLTSYALSTQAYLKRYDLMPEALGHIAVSNRKWAALNPEAMLRDPLDLSAYLKSPSVSDPLRVLDCAFPVNGAFAAVVSNESIARSAAKPVEILGYGQAHVHHALAHVICEDLEIGARAACARALKMANRKLTDIDAFELYDAFTIMSALTVEEYGLCEAGAALDLFASGATAPGGKVPVSTGGGHTSGGYLQGASPLVEGLLQVRREAGDRQVGVDRAPTVLVSNIGGVMDHHATMILAAAQ